jgi:hypothetical protein
MRAVKQAQRPCGPLIGKTAHTAAKVGFRPDGGMVGLSPHGGMVGLNPQA